MRFLLLLLLPPALLAASPGPTWYQQPLLPHFSPGERTKLDGLYRGDFTTLTTVLWQRTAASHLDLNSRLRLLSLYADLGEQAGIDKALASYRSAVARHTPWQRRSMNLGFYLAWAAGIAGRYQESLSLHQANYRQSGWTRNLYFAARMLLQLGKPKEAETNMRLYLQRTGIHIWQPDYWLELADFFRRAGDHDRAAGVLRDGSKSHWKSLTLWMRLLETGGHLPWVREHVGREGMAAGCHDQEILFRIISWFIEFGHPAEARAHLERLRPRVTPALRPFWLMQRVRLAKACRDNPGALTALDELALLRRVDAGPGETLLLFRESLLLQARSGQTTQARNRLTDKARTLLGGAAVSLLELELFFHEPATNNAPRSLATAFPGGVPALLTNTFDNLQALTEVLCHHDLTAEAVPLWQARAARDPHPATLWQYGTLLRRAGRPAEAWPLMHRAWHAVPDSDRWLMELSHTALEAGKYEEATACLKRMVCRLGLDYVPDVMSDLGFLEYRRLLAKKPEPAPVEKILLDRFPLPVVNK